ncbi:MAG: guanylate kinase [Eubacteriales bacterium]
MLKTKDRGQLIVLSGPSGVGKSTVIAELISERKNICFSVSYTTRNPRMGEQDGINYNFVSTDEFEAMIERDEFLEHAKYVDNYYGTSTTFIEERLNQGLDVLLDIEVQGAAKVREKCPGALLIFIIPPTFEDLSHRLRNRATDNEDVILDRLEKAKLELKEVVHYDYLVINDKVSTAVEEIKAILTAAECRVDQRKFILKGELAL